MDNRLDVNKVKVIALVFVIYLILHNIYTKTITVPDTSTCKNLLDGGHFLPNTKIWKPAGCSMHNYTTEVARQCFKHPRARRSISFIGDSRVRYQYRSFLAVITGKPQPYEVIHHDIYFEDQDLNLTVNFIWRPVVGNGMRELYENWTHAVLENREALPILPEVIINGGAIWNMMKNHGPDSENAYAQALMDIVPFLKILDGNTHIIWMLQEQFEEDKLSYKEDGNYAKNNLVSSFNRQTQSILNKTHVNIWRSVTEVANQFGSHTFDGMHIEEPVLKIDSQILINFLCNKYVDDIPDNVCCGTIEIPYPWHNLLTDRIIAIFIVGCTCLYVALTSYAVRCAFRKKIKRPNLKNGQNGIHKIIAYDIVTSNDNSKDTSHKNQNGRIAHCTNKDEINKINSTRTRVEITMKGVSDICVCIWRISVMLIFLSICERPDFFETIKEPYPQAFLALVVVIFIIVGFMGTRPVEEPAVLNRNQTNEWKGWMQLLIVIYNSLNESSSQNSVIHYQLRAIISSYLFLSGYVHFHYFYTTADFSLHRVFQIIVRYNFIAIILSITMNRSYTTYMFIPIVTFWFIATYMGMGLKRHLKPSSYENIIGKKKHVLVICAWISTAAILITFLFIVEKMLHGGGTTSQGNIFSCLEDHTFWSYLKAARYTPLYGMLASFSVIYFKAKGVANTIDDSNLFSYGFSIMLVFLAMGGILGYSVISWIYATTTTYEVLHSYFCFIPIVSYVFLRNCFGWIRARYNYLFAWIGKFSLEFYIVQHHIWRIDDGRKIRFNISDSSVINFGITLFICICISHDMHSCTKTLTKYIVPSDHSLLVRNAFIGLVASMLLIFHNCYL